MGLWVTAGAYLIASVLRIDLHIVDGTGELAESRGFRGEFRLKRWGAMLGSPFSAQGRAIISVSGLLVSAASLSLVPIGAYSMHRAGGDAELLGLAISLSGLTGATAAYFAGKSQSAINSISKTLGVLVGVFIVLGLISVSETIALTLVLIAIFDAMASWVHSALPNLRMRMEDHESLVTVSAGQLVWGSVVSGIFGVVLSIFSEGRGLVWAVISVCAISIALLGSTKFLPGFKKMNNSIQGYEIDENL